MVLEKTLESPLDCKEIQPVYSEGDQPWDFFERNNLQSVGPITIIINKSNTEFKRPTPPLERVKILFILVWSAKC